MLWESCIKKFGACCNMPKKFNFSLETLLKLRGRAVEARKIELGKVVSLKEKRINDVAMIEKSNEENNNSFTGSGQALYAIAYQDYKKSLSNEKVKILDEIKKIEEVENIRRKNLNLAMQKEKVIEKLREKKLAEYKKELDKEENDFLDEIAQRMYRKEIRNNI
jgi:flagellar FliJ protein